MISNKEYMRLQMEAPLSFEIAKFMIPVEVYLEVAWGNVRKRIPNIQHTTTKNIDYIVCCALSGDVIVCWDDVNNLIRMKSPGLCPYSDPPTRCKSAAAVEKAIEDAWKPKRMKYSLEMG